MIGLAAALPSWAGAAPAPTAQTRTLTVADTEVPVSVYPAHGRDLLLWLPSEHGYTPAHEALAGELARLGIESWLPDLYAAYFLPPVPSSLEHFAPELVAGLIEAARGHGGRQVYLFSHDRGAVPALEGARAWQLAHPGEPGLGGAVLISPYLLTGTPEPGQEPRYRAIAGAANLPIYVLQPDRSPLRPRLADLQAELRRGGSHLFLHRLPEARDRFFFRPDATAQEQALAARLPGRLGAALGLLKSQPAARQAAPMGPTVTAAAPPDGARRLAPYRGDPVPPPLDLPDLQGRLQRLADHRGRVLLINFWASWCPPCVHEMPSMQRLARRLEGRPFEILAVNLGEAPQTVAAFVETLGLDFPVLLDADGSALRDWKIFAYPTSFLLDKQGRIRYALFGAVDWLEPETLARIEELMEAP